MSEEKRLRQSNEWLPFIVPLESSLALRGLACCTAEMIKYGCNAFHALKIAFANEIGALAGRLQVNGLEVMETLCKDRKLNVSEAYLKPGFAFGGSCLPKDLRALSYRASRMDLKLPLLQAALPSNDEHLDRAIQTALNLPGRIGVVGLAFKEDTDDLRESPIVKMLEYLVGKGREVRVYDPHIRLDSIYGSNKNFILNAIPHIGRLLEPEIDTLLSWANHLVTASKPAEVLASRVVVASGRPALLDPSGIVIRICALSRDCLEYALRLY